MLLHCFLFVLSLLLFNHYNVIDPRSGSVNSTAGVALDSSVYSISSTTDEALDSSVYSTTRVALDSSVYSTTGVALDSSVYSTTRVALDSSGKSNTRVDSSAGSPNLKHCYWFYGHTEEVYCLEYMHSSCHVCVDLAGSYHI